MGTPNTRHQHDEAKNDKEHRDREHIDSTRDSARPTSEPLPHLLARLVFEQRELPRHHCTHLGMAAAGAPALVRATAKMTRLAVDYEARGLI
jgi:hypothetical protein